MHFIRPNTKILFTFSHNTQSRKKNTENRSCNAYLHINREHKVSLGKNHINATHAHETSTALNAIKIFKHKRDINIKHQPETSNFHHPRNKINLTPSAFPLRILQITAQTCKSERHFFFDTLLLPFAHDHL